MRLFCTEASLGAWLWLSIRPGSVAHAPATVPQSTPLPAPTTPPANPPRIAPGMPPGPPVSTPPPAAPARAPVIAPFVAPVSVQFRTAPSGELPQKYHVAQCSSFCRGGGLGGAVVLTLIFDGGGLGGV